MRNVTCFILALILFLLLCACDVENGNEEATAEQAATKETLFEETHSSAPTAPTFYIPDRITLEDSDEIVVDQCNRHGMNVFCFDNSWIYGVWSGQNYTGEVVKVRYDNSDWTVIDADTNGVLASCQAVKNGFIYYTQSTEGKRELVKVRSSGEDAKVIVSNVSRAIQIVDEFIYYTTPEYWVEEDSAVTQESSHLYRCDLDGENAEVILETPVYYFTVFGQYVLYQDDRDNMTLHIYDIISGQNIRINEQCSFTPIYDGNYIYYLSSLSTNDQPYELWRTTFDGRKNEKIDLGCSLGGLLLRGDYVYFINVDDSNRIYRCQKDGADIELVTQDANISSFQWVKDCLAYMTRDENGYIAGIYLCNADGSDRIEFRKSDSYWNLR